MKRFRHWYECASQKDTSVPAAMVSVLASRESSTEFTVPPKVSWAASAFARTSHSRSVLSSPAERKSDGSGNQRTTLMALPASWPLRM